MPDEPSSILGTPKPIEQPKPQGPQLRDIGDHVALRKSIYDKALSAVHSWKPMEYSGVRLEMHSPHYDGPEEYSLKDQKKAILERGTLGRRLRGTWRLTDVASGKPIDEKTTTLANIPFLTQRGTFIDNGNEYALVNQSRLRAGIYSRQKENGEFETFVAAKPGNGISHRYFLDPEKGVFFTNIGSARIPLITLMRTMGHTDRDFKQAWGPDIAARNLAADQPHLLKKYHERFLSRADQKLPDEEKTKKLVERLESMELDPEVTSRTMPKPYTSLNRHALMDITKRLLSISRGEGEADNRDDLGYQMIFGPEDNISERLEKDYGDYRKKLLWRAARDKSLRAALPGYLNDQVRSSLLKSGLANHLEETNLGEVLDKQFRITRMGEGGLGSENVPGGSRAVQDSYLGFIDPLKTPESENAGVDLYLARGVKKGSDGKIYAPFMDPRTGEQVYRSPQDVAKSVVAFPQQLDSNINPGKRAWAVRDGKLVSVRKRDVNLILPHFEDAFTPLSNLIPMKSGIKGQRASMTSRFLTQALPLVDAEAPLVQSGVPNASHSFEREYGEKLGAVFAKQPAKVMSVKEDGIHLRYQDGKEETIELANRLPFNRRTYFHQEVPGEDNPADQDSGASTYFEQKPAVQAGQIVQPGQILARSNYTDAKGHAALGLNARVAYIADSYNHEDAISISEGFAKRLSSDHMFPYRFEPSEGQKVGRGSYVSLFPHKFNRQQIEKIDENGLVKPGTKVEYGDPLILSIGERSTGGSRVHKRGGSSFTDAAVTWDKKTPGEVTDAVMTRNGQMTVLVRGTLPTQTADKLSARWANKGVVNVRPDDEMPQDSEGNPMDVLLNPHGIPSRVNPSSIIETVLGKIAAKTGNPYVVHDFDKIDDLAGFAQDELRKHGMSDLEDLTDPKTGKKIKDVLTGVQHIMKLHHLSAEKQHGRGIGAYTQLGQPSKGEGKSKRLSMQETGALLASGSFGLLRDASQVRGQRNEDFWLNFIQGNPPPKPDVPLVYKKFTADLYASGINVVPQGSQDPYYAAHRQERDGEDRKQGHLKW
jgi:DNA-directed RNA polymerase subunit beta